MVSAFSKRPRFVAIVTIFSLALLCYGTLIDREALDKLYFPIRKNKQLQKFSSSFSFSLSDSERDPFAQPGYLFYDEREPLSANWIPFDTSTPPSPDWLTIIKAALGPSSSIQENALRQISPLTHHTILIIGDSVDRQNIEFMSENLEIKLASVVNHNSSLATEWSAREAGPHEGPTKYDPRLLIIPSPIDLIITNCFIYGLDDKDHHHTGNDWRPPGLAESRLESLCKPYLQDLNRSPTFIMLHSGLWDMALFGRQDLDDNHGTKAPLTSEQLNWWYTRAISLVRKTRKLWPGVPIIFRKLHRASAAGAAARYWHDKQGNNQPKFTDFFTDIRTSQIRNRQESLIQALNLKSFDWGMIWEGFQEYSYDVHPNNYPGGVVMDKAILNYAYREAF